MLYHLFEWFKEENIKFPGSGLFQFITFRVLLAVLLSLVITMVYGKRLIRFLLKRQVGETVRDLGLAGEQQKKGTPTMGGIIILLAILIPTLLFANLNKVYVRLMILSTVWLGIIGPDSPPLGEVRAPMQLWQKQFAQTAAHLLGLEFRRGRKVALPIITAYYD